MPSIAEWLASFGMSEYAQRFADNELLFKERCDSVWLANLVQVYPDLLRSGGRAEEAAEHLRRERIGV